MRLRRRPRVEEIFVLNGLVALAGAALWLVARPELLLEFFYFAPLLATTHLVTLGFLSSLMMGVLYRLAPMLLGVEAGSRRLAVVQLVLFLVGVWGMVAHFWIREWTGMSWSAGLVWGAAVLQLVNFRRLFRRAKKDPWPRRFVAAAVVQFLLAASLGLVVALLKAYDLRPAFLSTEYLPNVIAHAHIAGAGWVASMIFGFELELVPSTVGARWSLPVRFALLHLGTLGLAFSLLSDAPTAPFALALALSALWQGLGPVKAFVSGRAREWEVLSLTLLAVTAVLGVALALGWPDVADPARARAQLAYGLLALFGFMSLTVVTLAFKLFPIWVWKERFASDFGKKPVPGMKDLPSGALRRSANLATFSGSAATALAVWVASPMGLRAATLLLAAGLFAFLGNLVRVVRWSFLDVEYRPTRADEIKFRGMFSKGGKAD
jgi:hypothetical protein